MLVVFDYRIITSLSERVAVNTSSDAPRWTGQVTGGSSRCCQDSVISDETMSGE